MSRRNGPRVMPPPRPIPENEPHDAPWPDRMRQWPPPDAGAPPRRARTAGRAAAEALLHETGWRWSVSAGGWVHPDRRGLAMSYRAAVRAAGLQ